MLIIILLTTCKKKLILHISASIIATRDTYKSRASAIVFGMLRVCSFISIKASSKKSRDAGGSGISAYSDAGGCPCYQFHTCNIVPLNTWCHNYNNFYFAGTSIVSIYTLNLR